jgi:hypothetical protein
MDRRYSHVIAQRPEGGPDGGRDIEAIRDGIEVWGAVGFQNAVSDSPADKRQACKKFSDDLDAALRRNPDLKGYVFFTNVDLTEAERNSLEALARGKGLALVDVYWRERLRQALDSPEGLAYRYQYLAIAMSEAEQTTFFNRFGSELHEAITRQHETIVGRLERLEFLHEMARPLREIRCLVDLRRKYTTEELGGFQLLVECRSTKQGIPSIWIGTESRRRKDEKHDWLGQTLFLWMGRRNEAPTMLEPSEECGGPHETILFCAGMTSNMAAEVFDERMFSLYVSQGIEDKIAGLWVSINGYAVEEPGNWVMGWYPTIPLCPWQQSHDGKPIKWMGCGGGGYVRMHWSTPRKLVDARKRPIKKSG